MAEQQTAEFNSIEHLQSLCRKVLNPEIKKDFADVSDELAELDISTTASSLRAACLHIDNDSLLMTVGKLLFYYLVINKAQDLQAPIYGIPKADHDYDTKYKPKLYFYFEQDKDAVPNGYQSIKGRIHTTLMDESLSSISPTKAHAIATEIKRTFIVNGQGITWDKGKYLITYFDQENGYDLRLLSLNKEEGISMVKKFIGVRNHTYNASCVNVHTPEKDSVNVITTTHKVYDTQVKDSRFRPTGKVRFIKASLQLRGLKDDIMLVNTRRPYKGLITV